MATKRGDAEFDWNYAVRHGNSRRLRSLILLGIRPPQATMLGALLHGHPDLLAILKQGGADPDSADAYGETALGYSVSTCDARVTAMVLAEGADPNKESLKLLPLLVAASMGKDQHVEVLLSRGADPNRVQWNGLTALLQAVRFNELCATRLLLNAGANPLHSGPDGLDCLDLGRKGNSSEILKLIEPIIKKNNGRR